jgi:hydroxypyruvate isomerase
MGRINQSLCLGCYQRGDITLEQLIKFAAETGFAAVEFWAREGVPCEQVVELTSRYGIRVASMSAHGTLTDGMNKRANHSRIIDEIHESIELARKWSVPGLITFSGNRNGLNDIAGAEACAECLSQVVPHAEEAGINLNMELLNSKVNHPDYQCDHTAWGVHVCKMVGSPRAKLLYDIYHMQIMEGDLIRTITDNIQYIGHFHTAGNPGRKDMDETQEIYYPAVMRAIADAGFELFVGHEFGPKGEVFPALKAAFDTCNI